MDKYTFITENLRTITGMYSSIAWPTALALIIYILKDHIGAFLARVTEFEIFGAKGKAEVNQAFEDTITEGVLAISEQEKTASSQTQHPKEAPKEETSAWDMTAAVDGLSNLVVLTQMKHNEFHSKIDKWYYSNNIDIAQNKFLFEYKKFLDAIGHKNESDLLLVRTPPTFITARLESSAILNDSEIKLLSLLTRLWRMRSGLPDGILSESNQKRFLAVLNQATKMIQSKNASFNAKDD